MAKFKVLQTDSIFPDKSIETELLSKIDAELITAPAKDEDTLVGLVDDVDAILTTYGEVTEKVIDACNNCKVIARTGIGVNNIDIDAATERGIIVSNVLNYCIPEVADHAIALMLVLLRQIHTYNRAVHNGVWDVNKSNISRLDKLTLGLYGFGNIARAVATRAQALEMRVIANDPYLDQEVFDRANVESVEVDELIESSDVLSIHLPLLSSTEKIINADVFKKMKNTAYLLNIARGGLVDENALIQALIDEELAGAGLDVMATEPGDVHSPLMTFQNVIITPHTAFYSEESNVALREKSTEQIIQTLTEGKPEFWYNKKAMQK